MNTATAIKKFALAALAAPVLAALAIGMAGAAHADNGTVNRPPHHSVNSDTGRVGGAGSNGVFAGQTGAEGCQGGKTGLLSAFGSVGSGRNDGKADRLFGADHGRDADQLDPIPADFTPINQRLLR